MACASAALPTFLMTALAGVDTKYITMIDDAVFVCSIREYLVDDMLIGTYRDLVASRLGTALAYMSTTLMTIWVAYQGFMIISGANRQPVLSLIYKTAKMLLIMSLVALVAAKSPEIANTVLNFQALVTAAVVDNGTDVYQIIDINLALAQVFNALIDGLVGGQQAGSEGKSLTTVAGLIGQSGPAMLVSVMALMAEVSITLAIMLAPLFIFFLMFQQTSAMFWSWAKFLLGTMFSLAVLALLSGILLKMMMMYGATVLAGFYLNGSPLGSVVSVDIGGSAMRMAMMGTLATSLLVMIPPLIMQFFNSGASFAAGAMMGAMGGGAAAGGVMGLSQAMGGQQQQGGGAASGGAIGRSDASGGGDSTRSESNFAARNNQAVLNRANGTAGAGSGDAQPQGVQAPGSIGIANQQTDSQGLAFIKQKQSTEEFRNPTGSSASTVAANSSAGGPYTPVQVADMNYDAERGVYTTESTNAALANGAGSGGSLKVSGGVGDTPTHQGDRSYASVNGGASERPSLRYGRSGGDITKTA